MQIQKMQIISDLICYGPCPRYDEEVKQHLTVSASGRVWFAGYNYGAGFNNYVIGRRQQFNIGKEVAGKLLDYTFSYYKNKKMEGFITDIGSWTLNIMGTDGKKFKKKGSMCSGITIEAITLTEYIRKHIPVKRLELFGGFEEDDAQ